MVKPTPQHISIIKNAGIPIAVWIREEIQGAITMLRDVIQKEKYRLRELPEIVRTYRYNAPWNDPHHIGNQAILLWDEPKRIPKEFMAGIQDQNNTSSSTHRAQFAG